MNSPFKTRRIKPEYDDKDESIRKAAKVIEKMQDEIEKLSKELAKQQYDNEYVIRENKQLEKQLSSMNKDINQVQDIKRQEKIQKQKFIHQKDILQNYTEGWIEQEKLYKQTIIQLQEQIKQITNDYQNLQQEYQEIMDQYRVKENGFSDTFKLIQQYEVENNKLKEKVLNYQNLEEELKQGFQMEFDTLKRITESILRQQQQRPVVTNQLREMGNQMKSIENQELYITAVVTDQLPFIQKIYHLLEERFRTLEESNFNDIIDKEIRQKKKLIESHQKLSNQHAQSLIIIRQLQKNNEGLQQQNNELKHIIKEVINKGQSNIPNLDQNLLDIGQFDDIHYNLAQIITKINRIKTLSDSQGGFNSQGQNSNSQLQRMPTQQSQSQRQQSIQSQRQNTNQSQQFQTQQSVGGKQLTKQDEDFLELQEQNQLLLEQLNQLTNEHTSTVQMLENALQELEGLNTIDKEMDIKDQQCQILEKENENFRNQINELEHIITQEHEELDAIKTQLEKKSLEFEKLELDFQEISLLYEQQKKKGTSSNEKQLEKYIENFLDQSALPIQQKKNEKQTTLKSKIDLMMGIFSIIIDSYNDFIQKIMVAFIVSAKNDVTLQRQLNQFDEEFHQLKLQRHKIGVIDYLDRLDQLKKILVTLVESELKKEHRQGPDQLSTLIHLHHKVAQKYLDQVNKSDSMKVEQIIRQNKCWKVLQQSHKIWKNQLLNFSEILYELGESLRGVSIQSESITSHSLQKLDEYLDQVDNKYLKMIQEL
ncbi:hypothetical protein pb186bvf_012779 [Paramecium bursaria]